MTPCKNKCVQACSFCTHYHDEENVRTLSTFVGKGICDIDNSPADAIAVRKCENFNCFKCN